MKLVELIISNIIHNYIYVRFPQYIHVLNTVGKHVKYRRYHVDDIYFFITLFLNNFLHVQGVGENPSLGILNINIVILNKYLNKYQSY